MPPESFISWLSDMKAAGLARSDKKCAELLGITANGLIYMKRNGCDKRTALACRALLHRFDPYK